MKFFTSSQVFTLSTNFAILTFGLSCSGHMSTMPVTRDSTMQNSESMPMVTSMKKKTTAQTEPPGSFNTTLKMIMVVVGILMG